MTARGNATKADDAFSRVVMSGSSHCEASQSNDVDPATSVVYLQREIRRAAMNYLARREHSRIELTRKLSKKFSEYTVIDTALSRLEDDGLLSDKRFVEAYIGYRRRAGFGPIRIAAELRDKGIRDSLSSQHIDAKATVWSEMAALARRKKFGESPPGSLEEKARQQKFLIYRGFQSEHFIQCFR